MLWLFIITELDSEYKLTFFWRLQCFESYNWVECKLYASTTNMALDSNTRKNLGNLLKYEPIGKFCAKKNVNLGKWCQWLVKLLCNPSELKSTCMIISYKR